jgi:hypothetical protein
MLAGHLGRKRATHREPHHHFGAFHAAQRRVFGDRHRREALRIALEEVEEAAVPFCVVETRALSVHLVRKPAGGCDRDAKIARIARDRAAQRVPQLVEAPRGRNRELQHAHRERHECQWPARLGRAEHRQRREAAVVERAALEERHVELVGHDELPICAASSGCPRSGRVARAAAFVGHRPLGARRARSRVVVEREEVMCALKIHRRTSGFFSASPPERRELRESAPTQGRRACRGRRRVRGRGMRDGDAAHDAAIRTVTFSTSA